MKLKSILLIVLTVLIVVFITDSFRPKKKNILALGSDLKVSDKVANYLKEKNKLNKYTTDFVHKNTRTTDIIRDFEINSKTTNKQTIKNSLIKADYIILSVGENDLKPFMNLSDSTYDQINEYIKDLEKLLIILRKYCKEKIFLVNNYKYLGNDEYYCTNLIVNLCKKYNIQFINEKNIINHINI